MLFSLAHLVLSVSVPPHARVNYRCHPVWNGARSNLDVMWGGQRRQQPWVFDKEVDIFVDTCMADACVQRLWCTDSGAAGRYVANTTQRHVDRNVALDYTWLLNTSLRGQRKLAVQGQEGDSTVMEYTSVYGHGTVLVMGSTLFFYTYDWQGLSVRVKYGLPRLSSLTFAEYAAGKTADELVTQELTAFNVLGYGGAFNHDGNWSPLYPAGRDALTISVADLRGSSKWAVDVALAVSGAAATRVAMVHYSKADTSSVEATSREMLTVPGFACRAFANGTAPLCHRISGWTSRYTWAHTAQTVLDMTFASLIAQAAFSLPSALWLHSVNTGFELYRVLATFGLGSVVAFDGSTFYGVETRAQAGCASGDGLFLATYDVSGSAPAQRTLSASLGCASAQHFPDSLAFEVPFEATPVKWLGPFEPQYVLFAASDIGTHEYYQLNEGTASACRPGQYRSAAGSLSCPAGFFCPGTLDGTDERRACPAGSLAPEQGMAKCTVSAGYYFQYSSSVELCDSGSFCPGGLSEREQCPSDRPRSRPGAWSAAQCFA